MVALEHTEAHGPLDKKQTSKHTCEVFNSLAHYVSYMPFVQNGGLFIPNKKSNDYTLGDDIFHFCVFTAPNPLNYVSSMGRRR